MEMTDKGWRGAGWVSGWTVEWRAGYDIGLRMATGDLEARIIVQDMFEKNDLPKPKDEDIDTLNHWGKDFTVRFETEEEAKRAIEVLNRSVRWESPATSAIELD